MRRRFIPRGLLAAGLAMACGMAGASGLQVAPVGLEFLPSSSPALGLWLTNTGAEPLHAQVRVFHWTQADGKDVLTPTQALVASPPMLSVAPGAQQMVRVIRLGEKTAAGEDAYRLLVDELPQPEQQKQTGVRYVLRYSVPVFVEPAVPPDAAAIAAALRWSLVRDGDGIALQARNAGATHAQLSDASLLPPGGAAITLSAGLLGYVLPGMTMRWSLRLSAAQLPSGTQLKVAINGKPVEQAFAVDDLPR
ncbi:MAG: molecular chaperone [Proteobacteria bacterium]|nr:molecular chaperone [Pseudomonadota bacterium]